jgi:histidinol-phosphate aminotransferase
VVDEAYVNFADRDAIGLVADHPNVIVMRTLSKGYSLAGLRLGYLIARPEIVEGLIKVKDSYNCDRLSLAGGTAALLDQAHLAANTAKIQATRSRLFESMIVRGYTVPASQANFLWCTGGPPAPATYEALKARRILVRLMRYPNQPDGLRITIRLSHCGVG